MKRGGFWMTTVATGLAVAGLMTVGRAGLRSHGALFLQGQMKIAAGDTDNGLKLLAEAATGPQMRAGLRSPLEKASAEPEKPCRNMTPAATPKPKAGTVREQPVSIKPAPEPTLASAIPTVPMPPAVQASYVQDGFAYLPTAQREALRAQQEEIQRAQRVREREIKKLMHEVSFRYQFGSNEVTNAEQIRTQVQKQLRSLNQ